jgi:hypothetical protein
MPHIPPIPPAFSRLVNLKSAADSLSKGLGASGPNHPTISFYKLGEFERGAPSYSFQVPTQVAEMLSRPGSFRHVKVEMPAQSMYMKYEDIGGESKGIRKSSVVFQVMKMPLPPPPFGG